MKSWAYGCSLAAMLLAGSAFAGGDPVAGQTKADTCMGCHGIPGYSNAYPTYRVPRLGGQHPEYLEAALKAYRDGKREHPTMQAQAEPMSDQDIADLAAFLSQAPGSGETTRAGGDKAAGEQKAAPCSACHGGSGTSDSPAFPNLAGQHASYLVHSLEQYRDGQRGNAIMAGQASGLSDQDIRDLASYYANQPGLYTPRYPK